MTSKKSFRNPAVFTFRNNIKKNLFVSAGIAALLFVYYGSIWRIIGNYRYAIQSDGVLLVSKYGGLYEEYKGKSQSAAQQP